MLEVLIGRPVRKVISEKVVFPRQKQEKMTEQIKLDKTGNQKLESGNQKPVLKKRQSEQSSVAMDHLTRSSLKGPVYNSIMKRFNNKILLKNMSSS